MNLYESIKKNLAETDGRYYVLRKLQDAFDSLSEIDYGDQEDSPRYGNMEQGIIEQNIINEEIKNLVQDNNITKEEFDDVAKPYKDGFDISFSYYDYVPKHGKIEEADEGLYVFHDVKSDNREDAASWIHNFQDEAPKLKFKLSQPYPDKMWSVDFIGKKQDIEDYLIKLGYYTKDEIDKYKCIEPLNEAEAIKLYKPFRILDHENGLISITLDQDDFWYDWKNEVKDPSSHWGDGHQYDELFHNYLNTVGGVSDLDFDSENGMFCVYAHNMKDAKKVATLLSKLYNDESKMIDKIKKLNLQHDTVYDEEYDSAKPLDEADDSSNEFKDFLDTKKHTITELNSLIDAYLKQYPSETGISVASKNPKLPITKGDYNGWATICIGNHKNSGKVYVFEGKGDGSDDKEMSFEDFCKNYEFRLGREGE